MASCPTRQNATHTHTRARTHTRKHTHTNTPTNITNTQNTHARAYIPRRTRRAAGCAARPLSARSSARSRPSRRTHAFPSGRRARRRGGRDPPSGACEERARAGGGGAGGPFSAVPRAAARAKEERSSDPRTHLKLSQAPSREVRGGEGEHGATRARRVVARRVGASSCATRAFASPRRRRSRRALVPSSARRRAARAASPSSSRTARRRTSDGGGVADPVFVWSLLLDRIASGASGSHRPVRRVSRARPVRIGRLPHAQSRSPPIGHAVRSS